MGLHVPVMSHALEVSELSKQVRKEIVFSFKENISHDEIAKKLINAELATIYPYLKKVLSGLYDLNWSKEYDNDDNLRQTHIIMPFWGGLPIKGGYRARVFEFTFYTDSSDICDFFVTEWIDQQDVLVANTKISFSDWVDEWEEKS